MDICIGVDSICIFSLKNIIINKRERIYNGLWSDPIQQFQGERVQIINELKKEFRKVKIMVMDEVVVYEAKVNQRYL